MMNKVAIIGTGSVGSTIAYTLTVTGLVSEIVMIDINGEKAMGEALDIRQGTPFCSPCTIYAGSYRDAADANVVVLTSGIARKPGQSRLDLAQTNVNITKTIIPEIVKYAPNAFYVIVSNPVDILTYTFFKRSGLPENQIIGSGTILDTARLRARLSEYYNINQQNVHAYVMGEHGDSAFIPWSVANISNVPLDQCQKLICTENGIYPEINYDEIEEYVRKSGARVIGRKGATFYAVSISVCHIIKCLLGGLDTTMTVSTMMHGEYGIDDVCLSVLNMVGSEGAHGKILTPLTDDEIAKLHHSANCLKEIINNIEI
ncbi:MAG: L-lactate dehydrogenase [Clostridia bacterium]|nr:L-lactate dehydrogenase [Clostridia bacterium]